MPIGETDTDEIPPENRPLLWIANNDILRDGLINLDESGMGYQVIEATVTVENNTEIVGDFLVLNCDYLLPFNDEKGFLSFPSLLIRQLSISSYENTKSIEKIIKPRLKKNLNTLILINKNKNILPDIFPIILWQPKLIQDKQDTTAHEGFYRYSAFAKDYRIKKNGSVVKGTFASTTHDRHMIHSGFSATARYALPNPEAAKYVYIITPKGITKILRGSVSPNYNQAGGGVEVFFPEEVQTEAGTPYKINEA